MEINPNELPAPRPISIILLAAVGASHIASEISHMAFNRYLNTAVALCALISYAYTFRKWYKKRLKEDKVKNQSSIKNKCP